MRDFAWVGFLYFFLVGVAALGQEVDPPIPPFPEDAGGQEILFQETMAAILEFKKEFDSNPELYPRQEIIETVEDVVKRYGYEFERHTITTEDGYILEAHRIPFGRSCGAGVTIPGEEVKRVVWLQHGLMGDSSNWVITGNQSRGLAFELADACYDVWMGNFRGNTYSKRHISLEPTWNNTEFWNFSWHELGLYDVTANIDYALERTGASQLYYIGHSMGTTSFFVTMTERPEYNAKVKLFSALAPVTYMLNTRSIIVRIALGFLPLFEQRDNFQILSIEATRSIASWMCKNEKPTLQPLCGLILYLIGGYNPQQLDWENLPAILRHSPAGSSSKAMLHYGQLILNGGFQQYNNTRNGDPPPKPYDLTKMTVPTALYYGDNDYLADKVDVLRSVQYFAIGTIVRLYRIEDDFCSHLDFVWAKDQHTLINKPVMDFMEEFTNPPPTTPPSPGEGARHLPFGVATLTLCLMATYHSFSL